MPHQTYNDAFIADLIEERDAALAHNRELSQLTEVQEVDLQAASVTIKALVANVEEKVHAAQQTIRRFQFEVSQLRELIANAYNVHFDFLNVSNNEEWMNLFVSTLKDMRHIAEEQKNGGVK